MLFAARMATQCQYLLPFNSNNATPWLGKLCYTDTVVPAGCPVHIVTADAAPLQLEVTRWHGYNDTLVLTPSTTTTQGSSVEVVGGGQDCANQFNDSIAFDRYEVLAPGLGEGDSFFIGYDLTIGEVAARADSVNAAPTIGPPGACATPDWSTSHWVSCVSNADAGLGGGGPPEVPDHGCSAGGASSFVTVLIVALVARRRRSVGRRRPSVARGMPGNGE